MSLVIKPIDVLRRPLPRGGLVLLLVGIVLAWASLLGAAAPASAVEQTRCTCQDVSTATQVTDANVVFTGQITSEEREPVANNPEVFNYTYTVTVDAIYKGEMVATETTFRTDRVFGQCSGVFAVGTPVIVFAKNAEPLKVRACSGTAEATEAILAEVEGIRGPPESLVPLEPFQVTYSAAPDQPGEPTSITRSAAPGLALVLVALASLVVVRRLGRPRA